jgi:anti-sigma regulatory factor (Ser/Thr protein kinase)
MTLAESRRLVHAAAIYDSDEAFLAMVVPFLRAGVAAGEPTLLRVEPHRQQLVRDALGDVSGLTLLPDEARGDHPIVTLGHNDGLFRRHLDDGAAQVRMLSDVPVNGHGAPWSGWARYEAVMNHVFGRLPLVAVCPYDTRSTPPDVLDDVERTHQRLLTADGVDRVNPRFVEPDAFLAERDGVEVDPLEHGRPDMELAGPTPSTARAALAAVARTTALDRETAENLVFAASEIVTNAVVHGRPPVVLRAWSTLDRVAVAITDRGSGPADPFSGYLRDPGGALGLWLARQLCTCVTMVREPAAFTVRLVAGTGTP